MLVRLRNPDSISPIQLLYVNTPHVSDRPKSLVRWPEYALFVRPFVVTLIHLMSPKFTYTVNTKSTEAAGSLFGSNWVCMVFYMQ